MGCTCSRREGTFDYEELIREAVGKLKLHQKDCENVSMIWYGLGKDLKLSSSNFYTCASGLGLPKSVLYQSFFSLFAAELDNSSLRKPPADYSLTKLDAFSIMETKGSLEVKAARLFKNYDPDHDRSLSKEEIQTMVEEILEIALKIVPKLIEFGASDEALRVKLKRRRQVVYGVKTYMKTHFVELLFEGRGLSVQKFTERMAKPAISVLLSGKELRNFALEKLRQAQKYREFQQLSEPSKNPPPKKKERLFSEEEEEELSEQAEKTPKTPRVRRRYRKNDG